MKKCSVLILACLVCQFVAVQPVFALDKTLLLQASAKESRITPHKPGVKISEEAELPKPVEKEERSWFSRYKWWLLAGLVVIGGAAAAGGGGGGGGGDTTGNIHIDW